MTELAVYQPPDTLPARIGVPGTQDFDSWTAVASEVVKLANVIYDTPFVPDGLRSGPAVAAAILAGRELGLGPMTALANVHVIKGKPGLSALLMRALILAQGHQWRDVEVTDTRAVIEGKRKGESEWTRVAFTADQAKQAKIDLTGYPQDKLYARATTRLARRKFADVIAGMPYSAEDLADGGAALAGESYHELENSSRGQADTPAPRTAQRRTRAPKSEGPGPAMPDGKAPGGPVAGPDPSLPPLPGEDEPDPRPAAGAGAEDAFPSPAASSASADIDHDQHGTATRGKGGQLTALWTILSTEFGFGDDQKEQARVVVEQIIGRDLDGGTTGDLSYNEARVVLDTLSNWTWIAKERGESPHSVLIAAMVAADQAGSEASDG
jgi:hypothetical protein